MTSSNLTSAQALYDSLHARKAQTIIFSKRQEDVRAIQAAMDAEYERGKRESAPVPQIPVGKSALLEAAREVISCASDTYKKRNGHISSMEDDNGEKCWIVPFDAFEGLRTALERVPATQIPVGKTFNYGDLVRKKSGSWWEGKVVGFYSTKQTPEGYNVQLITPDDNGPVQLYPVGALESIPDLVSSIPFVDPSKIGIPADTMQNNILDMLRRAATFMSSLTPEEQDDMFRRQMKNMTHGDAGTDIQRTPEEAKPAENTSHYDRDGYCDNPERGY